LVASIAPVCAIGRVRQAVLVQEVRFSASVSAASDAWASDWKPLTPPLLPEIERSDQVPVHSSWYAQSSYVMWSATVQAGTFAAARARIMSSSSWEPGAAAFDGVVGAGVVGWP